jgi:endonuclease/exonuclease/phosphatase family metal-dependent hydrolase
MRSTRRRLITLFIALATFVAVLAPTPALAGHGFKAKRELTVMSRNLYLGADLNPAIAAGLTGDPVAFFGAIATLYGSVEGSDFEVRSKAIVEEIKLLSPDIIGLQEVSKWTVLGPEAAPPSYDFLEILLDDLAEAGLKYSVAMDGNAVSNNAALGPFPLLPNGTPECYLTGDEANPATCYVQFLDRDVILVADNPMLKVTGSSADNYSPDAQVVLPVLGELLSFNRGWVAIDGKYRGRSFRFINTHLEVFDPNNPAFGAVQEAQAAEFLAGPARKRGVVIAVGDFNSAADGSETETYGMLTKRWRFRDVWRVNRRDPGFTCCFNSGLDAGDLTSRIDLVLIRGWAWTRSAAVVGDGQFQGSAPLWASDHAGVVATIRLF